MFSVLEIAADPASRGRKDSQSITHYLHPSQSLSIRALVEGGGREFPIIAHMVGDTIGSEGDLRLDRGGQTRLISEANALLDRLVRSHSDESTRLEEFVKRLRADQRYRDPILANVLSMVSAWQARIWLLGVRALCQEAQERSWLLFGDAD
jgi:hypothetical protein